MRKADKLTHLGLHKNRLNQETFVDRRECMFARRWQEANDPPPNLNGGAGISQWLIHGDGKSPCANGELTQREAEIAATAIQWLGTNCGFSWLCETLEKAGYRTPEKARS